MTEDVTRSTVTTQKAVGEEEKERELERAFRAAPQLNKSPWHGLWALTNRDLVKWYKNPIQLIISLVQPVVWLGLFGKAFNITGFFSGQVSPAQLNAIDLGTFGTTSYFSYLSAGMLAFIILFTAAFAGMSVVWDRRFGFMNKALSTPVSRGSIVIGKIAQSTIRSLIQAAIVLGIAVVLGMDTANFSLFSIGGSFIILFLMSFGLSALFVMLALRSSDWQTQMAIINLLNLPLLFASNAMLPVKIMPSWLQSVVRYNPVSYAIDGVRQMLLGAGSAASTAAGYSTLAPLWVDFSVLTVFAVLLSVLGIVLSWRLLTK
ncbi:MAG TPA: ABC transporter permease [Nitrososphaerales archaeon]|nr:ABC transporter permease [Nitrososphaerales archaeon]